MLNAEDIEPYIERLPYLGLDIEEKAQDYIKVEYNPNRPDFSTDYGIVRALKGLLGLEKGCPKYSVQKSDLVVKVDKSVEEVRPYIVSALIEGITLDDETIRQIIAMQEDLHHTIGRRRAKVSIGIHNFDVLKPPIIYTTEAPDFRFVPLGGAEPLSMSEILDKTPVGQKYGWIVAKHKRYPILIDSLGQVLSFPPIINGELTRVTSATRNLFIDITATDLKASEDALAILVTTLADAGGTLKSAEVRYPNLTLLTPNLSEMEMEVELKRVKRLLGLKLKSKEAVECLARSRIDAEYDGGKLTAKIPRYRVDIMHPVDLVEEVAIGYGLDKITPTLPPTKTVGRPHPELKRLSAIRDVCVGLGLTEVMNLSLTSEAALYTNLGRQAQEAIKVEEPKSSEHEYLRDMLISSLLLNLATNIHEPYPQKLFELAKTFHRRGSEIVEEYHLAVITSHSEANYTEAKSLLDAITQQTFGLRCETKPASNPLFIQGRCAEIKGGVLEGMIGEIRPEVLQAFNLRMPAAALELNINQAIKTEAKQHK
jgi:phenylalanyl-tRNA synthetase beta chain